MPSPEVSIVIPLYNEAENLRPLFDAIRNAFLKLPISYEVIFVDDGSTDGGYEILKKMREEDPCIRLVRFRYNYGQTAGQDAGFKVARGSIIVTMDADLQNDPQDIPEMLSYLRDYDLVTGWRKRREDPWLRRVSSKMANAIRNWVSHETIADSGCTLRAFKRECLKDIKLYKGMHRFLPTLFKMEGFKVCEVEVLHHPRIYGKSKYNIRNRIFKASIDLLVIRWMQSRHIQYEIVREE
jgi:glycosyltransferase involved in cell wall biosynthesis